MTVTFKYPSLVASLLVLACSDRAAVDPEVGEDASVLADGGVSDANSGNDSTSGNQDAGGSLVDGGYGSPPPAVAGSACGSGAPGYVRTTRPAPAIATLAWQKRLSPSNPFRGNGVLADPAKQGEFYVFYQTPIPGQNDNTGPSHVMRSTNFGETWTQVSQKPIAGNAWGVAIDPNLNRCVGKSPCPPPTMYRPAGYGEQGVHKSIDGGVTWSNLFASYGPNGVFPKKGGGTFTSPLQYWADIYQIHVLPDDPPNHILVTYHHQANGNYMLESTDGGLTWELHQLPGGQSHYAIGFSPTIWTVFSQQGGGGATFRTTTAGRVGGAISQQAWSSVDNVLTSHASFTPWIDPTDCSLIVPTDSGGLRRSSDQGATWTPFMQGVNSLGSVFGSPNFVYTSVIFSNYSARGDLRQSPPTWEKVPEASSFGDAKWGAGIPPFGVASAYDSVNKAWVIIAVPYGDFSQNGNLVGKNGDIYRLVDPL